MENSKLVGCPSKECLQTTKKMTYEKLLEHLRLECTLMEIKCPMQGCKKLFERGNWYLHYEKCLQMLTTCKTCKLSMYRKECGNHNCVEYLMRELQR